MADPDRDTRPERKTDVRFDNWPIERYDAYENWPVERATPADDRTKPEEVGDEPGVGPEPVENVEWIGFPAAGSATGPYVYESERDAIYAGEVDRENERILIDDEATEREVESEESLGEHIEEIGEDHDWEWLSSFARKYLEDEPENEAGERHHLPRGFEHRYSDFDRRNLPDSSDTETDLAFEGSHTFLDETDTVHVLEREFSVFEDAGGTSTDESLVEVDERYLVAQEPNEETRAGDAEIVDKSSYELGVEVDPSDTAWEAEVQGELKRWHQHHLAPPDRD